MSEGGDNHVVKTTMREKINEIVHEYKGSSSSSDSDKEYENPFHDQSGFATKSKLFGRKDSLHAVLGGGKTADIILWRNKQLSGSILGAVTVIWLLFECIGYHLLTFFCHSLILLIAVTFLWSNTASLFNRPPPKYSEVNLPEDVFMSIAYAVKFEINKALASFRDVASGSDLKKFLKVIAGLWVFAVIGSWFSFLTLIYIVFVIMYTAPVFYEKYEDHVDKAANKAMVEFNKHYAVLDAKVLQKIPRCPLKDKKQH